MGVPADPRAPGTFVLSLDTEIAWGTFDHGGLVQYRRHFDQIRPVVRRLVDLLDRYHIPATWAFVGHLLLSHCEKQPDGSTHPDVLRPRYAWYPHDWHDCDPGTDVEHDPWWYGPDLLQMVLDAHIDHEVATHTFSHIVVDDPACTTEIFQSQLQACARLHQERGLDMASIVFPRNEVALLHVLEEFGVMNYRGRERSWYERRSLPRMVHKAAHTVDRLVGLPPPTYQLEALRDGRLVNIPASMFFLPRDGFRRHIPLASRRQQAKRGLRKAAERGEIFHLWFHPFNLGSDPQLFDTLEDIFDYVQRLGVSDGLQTLTMKDVGTLARQGTEGLEPVQSTIRN